LRLHPGDVAGGEAGPKRLGDLPMLHLYPGRQRADGAPGAEDRLLQDGRHALGLPRGSWQDLAVQDHAAAHHEHGAGSGIPIALEADRERHDVGLPGRGCARGRPGRLIQPPTGALRVARQATRLVLLSGAAGTEIVSADFRHSLSPVAKPPARWVARRPVNLMWVLLRGDARAKSGRQQGGSQISSLIRFRRRFRNKKRKNVSAQRFRAFDHVRFSHATPARVWTSADARPVRFPSASRPRADRGHTKRHRRNGNSTCWISRPMRLLLLFLPVADRRTTRGSPSPKTTSVV
jgi:hypothetical protein